MTVYKAVYEVITPYVDYDVFYPYQDNPINLKKGYCTFYEITRKNLTSGERRQIPGNLSHISATVEITMQIKLVRRVSYKDIQNNAPEIAFILQAYLKSDEALRLFYEKGYELAPIWSDIVTIPDYIDDKTWVQSSNFDITLYCENGIDIPSKPLNSVDIKNIKEIN